MPVEQDLCKATGETDPLIAEWVAGYDTDCGGYSFERISPESPFAAFATLSYDGDTGYLGLERIAPKGCDFIVIAPTHPYSQSVEFPKTLGDAAKTWEDKEAGTWRLVGQGSWCESDHDCIDCGDDSGDFEVDDEVTTPAQRREACIRCGGDGYVTSPGGEWAAYEWQVDEGYEIYVLPENWASSLINGDDSGLEESDIQAIAKFHELNPTVGHCLACSDSADFRPWNDAGGEDGRLAGDCLKFMFKVIDPPDTEDED